jgi:hypothetical protein
LKGRIGIQILPSRGIKGLINPRHCWGILIVGPGEFPSQEVKLSHLQKINSSLEP